ncbi:Adenylate cyclase type 5 [Eumeta japonica]|uniref:Adenylate cyclase type 5 n=1 Tax=Eumeta variegata TaxID=151549 RepID=A0A4C2A4H0_EUMVA|nr:Adenylate cyclase type 5 [Eumeta japonica]
MICNVMTFLASNVAGIMTHYPRELAQRRAFLETRECVKARLTTQRENQQQFACSLALKYFNAGTFPSVTAVNGGRFLLCPPKSLYRALIR